MTAASPVLGEIVATIAGNNTFLGGTPTPALAARRAVGAVPSSPPAGA